MAHPPDPPGHRSVSRPPDPGSGRRRLPVAAIVAAMLAGGSVATGAGEPVSFGRRSFTVEDRVVQKGVSYLVLRARRPHEALSRRYAAPLYLATFREPWDVDLEGPARPFAVAVSIRPLADAGWTLLPPAGGPDGIDRRIREVFDLGFYRRQFLDTPMTIHLYPTHVLASFVTSARGTPFTIDNKFVVAVLGFRFSESKEIWLDEDDVVLMIAPYDFTMEDAREGYCLRASGASFCR